MNVKSLEIKNTSHYYYDDIVHADEFDKNLIKVDKRGSRIDADIYYIGYIVNKRQYFVPFVLNFKRCKMHCRKNRGLK